MSAPTTRWEVWCVPTPKNTFHAAYKVSGPHETREVAEDSRWHAIQDEPAPDKHEFFRWEIRETT